jgi:hypothetical protein
VTRLCSQALVERMRDAASNLAWACPELGRDLDAVVEKLARSLQCCAPGPTHLDLKPDHVFLDGERITLIDVSSYGLADPVIDIGTLTARTRALPLWSNVLPERADSAAELLIEGYLARVPCAWHGRLGIAQACGALQVASSFFRHQHPRWRELVPEWVGRARELAG